MRIKTKQSNQYALTTDGIWVRNFTQSNSKPHDINDMVAEKEFSLFLKNELTNYEKNIPIMDQDSFFHPNIIIVSDGFDFMAQQELLAQFPKEITIIGVNRSLAKWKLVGKNCPPELKRSMTWYVVNNPYAECVKLFPVTHRYFPRCIASTRTNPEFIRRYEGDKFLYSPTISKSYGGSINHDNSSVDDYRNPICAAIGLAWKFKVQKLLLFCCDDSFIEERPSSECLDNGFYSYPQQQISRRIIDLNLYWLKEKEIKVGDFSKGIILEHAPYIKQDELLKFFDED